MKQSDGEAVRDKERTRRAVLEAAERALAEHGAKVSLADIASLAGVTKSGLMHHFPSREALLSQVIEHSITRMWEEVRAQVDLSEDHAGRFTRGYVRALTGGSDYLMNAFSPTGLIAALGSVPLAADFERRDAELWNRAFADDGLPAGRVLAVRFAAEGLATAAATAYLTAEQLAEAREELLALTVLP